MKEFDQCPGCMEDLLLEDPKNENGLHCLGCGYTCQADDAGPQGAAPDVSDMEKLVYWRNRCKAAEVVIESIENKNEDGFVTARQVWNAIKEEGEPA